MKSVSTRNLSALALAAVALFSLVSSGPVFAAGIAGFGVRPAHFDPADSATQAYFKRSAPAGASFSDQVVVNSYADSPLNLLVYPVDGLTGTNSGSVYANRPNPLAETGKWLRTELDRVALDPHSERTIAFTVQVPQDATPGDHLAGVAFENADPRMPEGNFAVKQVVRAVIGVLIRVEGPARPFELRLQSLRLHPRTKAVTAPTVTVQLGNRGQLLASPRLRVSVEGPRGYHRTLSRQLDTVLPGDSIQYPFPWPDDFSPGRYHVCAYGGVGDKDQTSYCTDLAVSLPPGPVGYALSLLPEVLSGASPLLTLAIFLGGLLLGAATAAAVWNRRRTAR
jgi:hypothetical protein